MATLCCSYIYKQGKSSARDLRIPFSFERHLPRANALTHPTLLLLNRSSSYCGRAHVCMDLLLPALPSLRQRLDSDPSPADGRLFRYL